MNIEFKWKEQPNIEQKKAVEESITNLTEINEKDCDNDDKTVLRCSLSINGPLDNRLEGIVQCSSGKKILYFEGNEFGDKLNLKWYL